MARSCSTTMKRKGVAKNTNNMVSSFVGKLQMLRELFVDTDEADLSACLRQCGCNVELAAERLMTGTYESKSSTRKGSNFFAMSTHTTFAASTVPATMTLQKTPSNRSNHHDRKRQRTTVTPATNVKQTPKALWKQTPAVAAAVMQVNETPSQYTPQNPVASSSNHEQQRRFWLCQRWVVGSSTTKHARSQYLESLQMTHSSAGPAMVWFSGVSVKGSLSHNLASLLCPLLRHDATTTLLSIEAHALMGDHDIPIGGDVPISLTVHIQNPVAFFHLFDSHQDESSSCARSQFFGNKARAAVAHGRSHHKENSKGLPIAEAAFALLQWAEYGHDPAFQPLPPSKQDDEESTDDNAEATVMDEDDFEAEVSAGEDGSNDKKTATIPEWAKNVVDATTALPEASDPGGFTKDVVLRPYQKQALHWMLQRESGNAKREEAEEELSLLAKLSRKGSRNQPSEPTATNQDQGIVCEVGPVCVSPAMALESTTIHGTKNPLNHPLWQRRFLASPDQDSVVSFYVNELLGIASAEPPRTPRPCVGGILADAMGLGKTVMLLALILKDKENNYKKCTPDEKYSTTEDKDEIMILDKKQSKGSGTTLVVAPLSLVSQWEEEIATKTNLTHRVYYAETAKGGIHKSSFQGIDVVVTTYGTIQGELLKGTATKGSGLLSFDWRRVILDESHCIKNPNTVVSRACCMVKADNRWCVTGTPIQNSLQDVYALLKFLRHEPWCEAGFWKAAVTNATSIDEDETAKSISEEADKGEVPATQDTKRLGVALSRVKRLLSPLILRRTKDTVTENGEPILTLPPLETVTVHVELSTAEREFYNSLMQRSQEVFEGFLKDGTARKSWFQIFALLNRLRQACDHVALTVKSQMEDDWNPVLRKDVGSPVTKGKQAPKDADAVGEKFLEGLLEKFRTKQTSDNEKADDCYASHVAHALVATIKSSATTVEDECPICLDCPAIHEAVITPCAHIFCRDCLVGTLQKNGVENSQNSEHPDGTCPSCNETIVAKKIISLSKKDGEVTTSYLSKSPARTSNVVCKNDVLQDSTSNAARQTLEKALRGAGSSKLTAVVNELYNVWEKDPCSKVLVFSQYLGFLDLLASSLGNDGIPSCRLDGKLSLKERVSVLEKFRQDGPTERQSKCVDKRKSRIGSVLLMSMKAGGVGINMVAASSVFIVDPWWNSATEDQCVSRIHRIGQTAEVVRVRKFVVRHSVEERIVMLQHRKKDMACQVLSDSNHDNDDALSNSTPTIDDFKLLFGSYKQQV